MTQGIRKLLIANRGEIAVRIIRAAKELGIPTVAACSEADVDSQAARMADEVHILGPARADKSYLNVEALLGALKATGANRSPSRLWLPLGKCRLRRGGAGGRGHFRRPEPGDDPAHG